MRCAAILVGVLIAMSSLAQGLDVEYVHPTEVDDPARQFDFWVGEWDINNWSKRGDDWVEWPAHETTIIVTAIHNSAPPRPLETRRPKSRRTESRDCNISLHPLLKTEPSLHFR